MDPGSQKSFKLLKSFLCGKPILKYADTSKPYTLYTDVSKYSWAGVLTQSHTTIIDGKGVTTDHPVAFVSGLFRGSQLNWAMLTKEAFAIYMSVKKLSFYLELESFSIWFEHIKGQNNVLADTLSCLIDIDPDTQLTPEGKGYEFGYAVFEELPNIKSFEINEAVLGNKEIKNDPDMQDALQCIDNPIAPE